MDKITESLLTEFSKEQQLEALDESKRFEHLVSFLVVRGEHSETFSTDDVVVGDDEKSSKGGGDTGIDGVAIIVNGNLVSDVEELEEQISTAGYLETIFVFIQAETTSGFDGSKIGTFGFGVGDFFREVPKLKRSAKISSFVEISQAIYAKSSKFRRGNPICKLFYVTTGKWNDDHGLQARIDGVKSDLNDTGLFRNVQFTAIGAEGIQKLYQRSRYAVSAEFTFAGRVTIPEVSGVAESHFGFLPWPEFKKIIIDSSTGTEKLVDGLFFDNVRDWQGYNEVNSDIKGTLASNDRKRFVLMNNGVTIIARSLQPTGNKFTIEDYQIVNGCQTTHVLFDQRDVLDDSVAIPVRLISTRNEEVTNAIIKATNWQTEITEEQLFALQQFPKTLEAFFASYPLANRLYFERRSRQYDGQAIEKTRVVTFVGLIRAFGAMFLNEPHRATRNYKALKARVGTDIFAKDQKMELYYVSALALYRIEFLFRTKRLEAKYKPARYHILTAVRILIAGFEMPAFTANRMEAYCKTLSDTLQDQSKSEEYVLSAARIVEAAAAGNFHRDNIRTERFTQKVIELAKANEPKAIAAKAD
ncbi:MAG TPA: AIPR family protein [Terriglobia bacterium]|nr:AIPR family protein [Terriglobia bacterium]